MTQPNDELDDFRLTWRRERDASAVDLLPATEIISRAGRTRGVLLNSHLMIITILAVVFFMIGAFMWLVAGFRETLSLLGCTMMLGSLVIRIVTEYVSWRVLKKIDPGQSAAFTLGSVLAFYRLRKKIHGPVLWGVLVAYTIGFFMLVPEFGRYLSPWMMTMMLVSFPVGAMIVAYSIRRTVREEMQSLDELLMLNRQLESP